MKYHITSCLEKVQTLFCDDDYRIIVAQGGTSAGKTISILWILLDYAITHENKVISIVSDTFPNLRKGAMRDFLNICSETKILEFATWNKSESTLTLPNGTIIEFFSTDMLGALGSRRDVLYVNEANRISWDTFSQLEVRTREKIIIDFNPVNEFWAHRELVQNKARNDVAFVKVTYRDNEALDEPTKQAIEIRRGDGTNNWWRVYGEGEIGSLEGNVYEGWLPLEEAKIRKGKIIRYGLDFGYSNDETALVSIYELEDGAIGMIQEIYEKGILPSKYPEILKSHNIDPSVLIVADGARPEIIAEIRNAGFRCIAARKDAGSVLRGIDYVQECKIYYCGQDLEHEYLTYAWRKKRSTGELLDEPEDGNDHCMDTLRYAIDDLHRPRFDF